MTASLLLLLAAAAASSPPLSQPPTRAEVAAQRAAIERRFAQEQATCQTQFAVSSCLDDVRQRRHDALAPLVKREHELAADERRARAAAQAQRVRERDLASARDEGQRRERIVAAPPPLEPATPASHAPRALSAEQAALKSRQAEQKAEADAGRRRERAQARQQGMQERLEQREAKEKRRTKPLAKPLPVPGAPASAASR